MAFVDFHTDGLFPLCAASLSSYNAESMAFVAFHTSGLFPLHCMCSQSLEVQCMIFDVCCFSYKWFILTVWIESVSYVTVQNPCC